MKPKALLLRHVFAGAAAAALGAAGCSTTPPPTDQMTVATASVGGAHASGAQTHAPKELKLANDKLMSAQKAMADKDHGKALRYAQQAQADAQVAIAATQAAKARQAADEATTSASAVREEAERNALRRNPGGPQ